VFLPSRLCKKNFKNYKILQIFYEILEIVSSHFYSFFISFNTLAFLFGYSWISFMAMGNFCKFTFLYILRIVAWELLNHKWIKIWWWITDSTESQIRGNVWGGQKPSEVSLQPENYYYTDILTDIQVNLCAQWIGSPAQFLQCMTALVL
jgi:hypothetical protein